MEENSADTGSLKTAKRKNIIRYSLAGGGIAVILFLLFVLLSNWLGLFLCYSYNQFGWSERICNLSARILPLTLTGKGFVRSDSEIGVTWLSRKGKSASRFLAMTLQSSRSSVQCNSRNELLGRSVNKDAFTAIPILLDCLLKKHPVTYTRHMITNILYTIVRDGKEESVEYIPLMLEKYESADNECKFLLLYVLSGMGVYGKKVIPLALKELDNPDEWIHGQAALTIGEIGLYSEAALKKLIPLLDTDEVSFRGDVIYAVGKLSIAGRISIALPAFKTAMENETRTDYRKSIEKIITQIEKFK